MSTPAGWYPDPTAPGIQRYWDGGAWSEHRAPAPTRGLSAFGLTLVIAAGILVAAAVAWFVYGMAHANDDLNCATENGDRALNGQAPVDCG